MRTIRKLMLAALAAGILLSLAAGTAAALRSIQINERSIHVHFNRLTFFEGETRIECEVTLRVVFNEDKIAKTAVAVGNVTAVTVAERRCVGGEARALTEELERRPWIVKYGGFTGTLPTIRTIRLTIERTRFLINFGGGLALCLYEGEAAGIVNVGARGEVTTVQADETRGIPLFRRLGGLFCPARGAFRGTSDPVVRLRDGAGGITIRLI